MLFRNCCSVWGCAGDTILRNLQKVQNRAARVVKNSPLDQTSSIAVVYLPVESVNVSSYRN